MTALDAAGATTGQTYSIVINPMLTIATLTLPNPVLDIPYSSGIYVSGGTTINVGPYSFAATGSLPTGLTLSSSGVLSGRPTARGSYRFTVTATDSVGASTSRSFTVTVSPGPFSQYLVTVEGSSTIQAGIGFLVTVQAADAYRNPVASYSGPATVTARISPSSAASNFPTMVSINSNGLGLFLANLHEVGTSAISVADSTGTFTGITRPLTVTPGPAIKLAFGAQPQNMPTGEILATVTVQVEDGYGNTVTSDNSDAVTVAVASGPCSFTAGSTTTVTVRNGVANFSNLDLVVPGNYTLSAIVPTKYTGLNSASFAIAPLQLRSFLMTLSGFSLQFNAPILVNSTTPVLYGQGFGATAPVPSVTMIGPSGPVEGSLVVDTTTNTITFVETDTASLVNHNTPILPFGAYTVVVRSSAANSGFQAQSGGGFLDGLGTGTAGSGDFTARQVLDPAGFDVLWVPATADGPGQALNAPGMNQVGGGYPIYLDDTTGAVANVQVTLNYNPALLTVTGVTGANFALLASSTPGHAVLQYSGPALAAGSRKPIGFVTATVPSGTAANPTPYKAKDLLHLSGVSLNGGAMPVATGDALHLVAYVGDADGNGSYSSNDAVLITRVAIQSDTGFAAYPLVDPVIVADTDGGGFIPADAALQVNEAGIGFPTANLAIPPIPSGVVFQPSVHASVASARAAGTVVSLCSATVARPHSFRTFYAGTLWLRRLVPDLAHAEALFG